MSETVGCIQWSPIDGDGVFPYQPYQPPAQTWYVAPWIVATPTDCAGIAHVFPCPHCNKCKCGKAQKVSE